MNNLSEFSKAYYQEHNIYKIFSEAEDYPDFIFQSLENEFYDKHILDLGCGNGKYSNKIQSICSSLVSADKSFEQLSHINQHNLSDETAHNSFFNHSIVQLDASHLPFKNETFDIVFSSWMLGTILDKNKQSMILEEMKRILKPQGKILLVENDFASEFEIIRGRWPDQEHRTYQYNNWILSQEFNVRNRLSTYFKFESLEQAQFIFQSIWKNRLVKLPQSPVLTHNVIIFEYIKEIEKINSNSFND